MKDWGDIFYYDGINLLWRVSLGCKKAGDIAGSVTNFGYRDAHYDGKHYLAHRIIWEMHNGPIPEGAEIDHMNHNRLDNRIENLRLVSHSENQKNQKAHRMNTSGVTGVHWCKSRCKWVARITVDGKHINLGGFDSKDSAVSARKTAEKRFGFHGNHGK